MSNIQKFIDPNGNTVLVREDGYVNATAMCESAGREWKRYRELEETEAFLNQLAANAVLGDICLVQARRGNKGGTYVHPRVAIHLAQWLSPAFAVWATEVLEAFINADTRIAESVIERTNDEVGLKRVEVRAKAKLSNKARNRAIQECGGDELTYALAADNTNVAVTGLRAKEIQRVTGVKNTRDGLSAVHLAALNLAELLQIHNLEQQQPHGHFEVMDVVNEANADVRDLCVKNGLHNRATLKAANE